MVYKVVIVVDIPLDICLAGNNCRERLLCVCVCTCGV